MCVCVYVYNFMNNLTHVHHKMCVILCFGIIKVLKFKSENKFNKHLK